LAFVSLLILLLGLFFFLPPTPRASKVYIHSETTKNQLLVNTPSPRIIFVGGSNLSFGLNSQEIKDSLHINPINTAIAQSLGIKYILESTMPYVKKGDIVVLALEYIHFFRDWEYASENLFRTIVDGNKKNISLLSFKQMYNCFPYTGKFVLSKFDKNEYINVKESDVYSINSFNKYGDVDAHWDLKNRDSGLSSVGMIDTTTYNPKVIDEIKSVANKLQEKSCVLLISYPCIQETTFNNQKEAIRKVEKEYFVNGFTILGCPQRYMMPDSLMFDTEYHLNKQGVERRTKLLIEDLRIVQND